MEQKSCKSYQNIEYSKKVIQNFLKPKNIGKIKNPSGQSKVGNPICGDVMEMFLKIDKKNKIKQIKFKTFGCAAAISTSSILTQLAKGKTIEEAKKITFKEVMNSLGGLPESKIHCAGLAISALRKAIQDFEEKEKKQ